MTAQLTTPIRMGGDHLDKASGAHVVVLMNFIAPYQLPVLTELGKRVRKLTVLISTPMEPNRSWAADWGGLDVQVQRTFSWRRPWHHPTGFTEENYVHVPWDTMSRLRALSPDVILSAELGMRSVFSACYTRFAKKTRLVLMASMSEHTERGRGRARTLLRKLLLRQCQCLVVNGQSGSRYVQALGLPSSRIFRCSYASNTRFFERGTAFRPAEIAHRLLYLGQFVERKGLLPFLTALREWAEAHRDRHVELDLVGSGPLEGAITNFAMPGNVHLQIRGAMPFEKLPDVYRNGGILAFPTLADEWGLVVNEALAAGMPVLGSRYSQAVEDLCVEGVSGWLYRPDVGNEMRQALETALGTSWEDLNTMRRAAREAVSSVTPEWAADVLCEAVARALSED